MAANGLPITGAVLAKMSDKDVNSLAQQGMGQQLDQLSDIAQLIDAALGVGSAQRLGATAYEDVPLSSAAKDSIDKLVSRWAFAASDPACQFKATPAQSTAVRRHAAPRGGVLLQF